MSTTAAEKSGAFETFSFGAHFVTSVGRTSFNDYWDPTSGGRLQIDLPFYLGVLQTGVHVFGNDNERSDVPEFHATFLFLGWGYEWELPYRIGWFTGVQAGGLNMSFDDDASQKELRTESELGFGLHTAVRYPTRSRWSALISADFRRIHTYRRIDYGFVGVGISRRFMMPRWLREFLE
ncbi:MAG: hypothetical protein JSW58_04235 [Candidatus Latescibacterota bacterium]|nr:MAG: hypothetical protein JSW58_04235 [Candidatus Latescibacterota bacterium]